jgi:hypothetical protein
MIMMSELQFCIGHKKAGWIVLEPRAYEEAYC